jgi:hypothetical protein
MASVRAATHRRRRAARLGERERAPGQAATAAACRQAHGRCASSSRAARRSERSGASEWRVTWRREGRVRRRLLTRSPRQRLALLRSPAPLRASFAAPRDRPRSARRAQRRGGAVRREPQRSCFSSRGAATHKRTRGVRRRRTRRRREPRCRASWRARRRRQLTAPQTTSSWCAPAADNALSTGCLTSARPRVARCAVSHAAGRAERAAQARAFRGAQQRR